MILWPAIIQYAGQAELAYIHDQAQWDADQHLHAFNYQAADRLIDSSGKAYSLTSRLHGRAAPEFNGANVSLDEAIQLIRAHVAQMRHCCIAKLSAGSIEQAILLLGALDE